MVDYTSLGSRVETGSGQSALILAQGIGGGFAAQLEDGKLTAEEVLRHYATTIYAQTQNYGETATRLKLDWRTVKKYVDAELLEKISDNT